MCGIAGIMRFNAAAREEDLQAVTQYISVISHRGPDSQKVHSVGDNVILGSARLRITDAKNSNADMPLTSCDGLLSIVFNGEIYNHKELRSLLSSYQFQTMSDTETLLAGYREWGYQVLERIEGMFSLCIYDKLKNSLFLAVDPAGQKPLYYTIDEDRIGFASELPSLLTDRHFKFSWDKETISEILSQRFSVGHDTHIREIKKIDGGCCAVVTPNSFSLYRYFKVDLDESQIKDHEVSNYLKESFSRSLASMNSLEVSGGIFLSGGLDSSSILAGLRSTLAGLPTFTVGFEPIIDQPTFSSSIVNDEFEFTKRLAKDLGSVNNRYLMDPEIFFNYWDNWLSIMGEPLCFNETAAHLYLFSHASKYCRIIFCGSGADELFDGYGFGSLLQDEGVLPGKVASSYYDRFNYGFGFDFSRLICDSNTRERVIQKLNNYIQPYIGQTSSTLQLVQLLMLHARLPHSEFRQFDHASMQYSVETRLPYANRNFINSAFAFSPLLKHKGTRSKNILRESFTSILPEYILNRDKVPFAPIGQLFHTPQFNSRLQSIFKQNSLLVDLGIVDSIYLGELLASHDPLLRPALSRLAIVESVLQQQRKHVQ